MSNIYKSSNINYSRDYYEIKFELDDLHGEQLPVNEENEENEIDFEKQRQLFYVELEQEKKGIIDKVILETQVQAEAEKDKIVNDAQQKADAILAEAQKTMNEAEENKAAIEQEAYDKGYNKGVDDAKGLVDEANSILSDITKVRQQTTESIEPEIITMIGSLFEKVVGIELDNNNDIIVSLIAKTLEEFGLKHSIVVKVSEKDYDYVLERKNDILSHLKGIDNFDIVKSEALAKGDCVVETISGEIDCSISLQLERIKDTIKNLLVME